MPPPTAAAGPTSPACIVVASCIALKEFYNSIPSGFHIPFRKINDVPFFGLSVLANIRKICVCRVKVKSSSAECVSGAGRVRLPSAQSGERGVASLQPPLMCSHHYY